MKRIFFIFVLVISSFINVNCSEDKDMEDALKQEQQEENKEENDDVIPGDSPQHFLDYLIKDVNRDKLYRAVIELGKGNPFESNLELEDFISFLFIEKGEKTIRYLKEHFDEIIEEFAGL